MQPIQIYGDRIEGMEMEIDEFLTMEGYEGKTEEEFIAFFDRQYGLPFKGYLVVWRDI